MSAAKRIMILGAGHVAFPLIARAKSRGLETVVVSPAGNYEGLRLADHHVDCDYRDTPRILEAAQRLVIDGILSTGTDVVVPTIGRVVDELGLRGTGYEAAIACSDKWLMKQALERHGVMTARGVICTSPDELSHAAATVGFPMMSKAVDSSGSQGIFRVDHPGQLNDAWRASQKESPSGRVVLEQVLDGIEFGAQAIVEGESVKAVLLHNDQMAPPPSHAPVGHSMPCVLPQMHQGRARREIVAAIAALGIRDTVSNIDLMLVDGVPYIIEVGARMGATCLPETISIFGKFDAYDVALSLALGERVSVADVIDGTPNASHLIRSPADGTVREIRVPDGARRHSQVHRLAIYVKPGDRVRKFRVGPDRIGDVIVTGSTAAEAETLAAELAAMVQVFLD